MNSRIKKLREESLQAVNRLSAERALLVTQYYRELSAAEEAVPVQRAKAFAYILRHKSICINQGELIVGERGPAPKATPTYPEINLHSLKDLEILNAREKVSFRVDEETRRAFEEVIIPYWTGRTNRERVFRNMEPAWIEAYQAGVFTEFQEQRAPGHTVLGSKIYHQGMEDLIGEVRAAMEQLDLYKDPAAYAKREELRAMEIAAGALIMFAERHADALDQLAAGEENQERRKELAQMAAICRRIPAKAPRTMHEALQYYWFVHLGVITELNPWDSFNPGRLDQHLLPFYRAGLKSGKLDKESAIELLQSFWIKFNNHPSPPKVGVTAEESNTYTDFCLINAGGLKTDGSDAVNELSYILLDVIEEMRLLQPSSMVQVSRKNPDHFVDRAVRIVKTGFGQPSIFNTDAIVQELVRQGKTLEDARNGGASGCVESGAFGTEAYILTGYFNLVKVLEITLHNGTDPQTGRMIGIESGDARTFTKFEHLEAAFRKQLQHFIDIKVAGSNMIEQIFTQHLPAPFLSLLIDDCISSGVDYNAGGARYNTNYIQGVGLGSITDIFTAIKYHVFDREAISMETCLKVLADNFEGHDEFRAALLYDTPKYGNDDELADQYARRVFDAFYEAVNGRQSPRGATYRINMLPTTSHVYFGKVCGATPDGRLAREPLSEGISPVQGMDRKGPTAVLNSALKIDHLKTGGTLLNQKFSPDFFSDERSIRKVTQLIRSYFRMDGHHIQFNVVSAHTLRDARKHPEKYQDLIVRVAGYSDYFNDLGPELQEEIIRRTEHEEP
ncbi:MAG: glycyl radical protein [Bacteroidales bacterium]|nr:glycyl radical protein [Bacteroidales bacterium]